MKYFRIRVLLPALVVLAACSSPATATPENRPPTILRDIVYCSPSGKDLKLDFYRPGVDGSVPAVVFLHGGNWASGNKTSGNAIEDIPILIQAGFAVASIQYRLGPAFKMPAQIEDAKCAVRFLRSNAAEYDISPDAIGAYGVRAGGHLAAMLGVTDETDGFEGDGGYPAVSSRVQAVVAGVGIFDLANAFSNELSTFVSDVFDNDELSFGDPFSLYSPISYVSQDDPPFFLYHGDQDGLSPLFQSQVFYQNLLGGQVDSTLVVLINGGTDFGPVEGAEMSPTREELRGMMVDFLRANLLP